MNDDPFRSELTREEYLERVIFSIGYYYTKNYPLQNSPCYQEVMNKVGFRIDSTSIKQFQISNTNQYRQLKSTLLNDCPHFETFKMKLPQYGNQWIEGIGIKEKVIQFYRELSQIGLFDRIDMNSYKTIKSAKESI